MKIIISGGGIAGAAVALYLKNFGHQIKMIDKVSSFQNLGYGLSLKGFGVEITKELGLYKFLKERELSISSFAMFNSKGKILRVFPKTVLDEMTGETVPIARRDLHNILFSALPETTNISFNTTITSIEHTSEFEIVTFSNGVMENFDLVIITEGLRSSTRRLLLGETGWKPLDITYAATFINCEHHFELDKASTFKGVGKTIAFFPISKNKIAIQASFSSKYQVQDKQDNTKDLLKMVFKDFSNKVTNLLNVIDSKTFIFYDTVSMVNLPSYVNGRTVFLGDAASCPTFMSGMGASLSMLGAKVLSNSLTKLPNIKEALQKYDSVMHPLVSHFQKNAISNMNRELPNNNFQAFINNLIISKVSFSIMKKSMKRQLLTESKLLKDIQ